MILETRAVIPRLSLQSRLPRAASIIRPKLTDDGNLILILNPEGLIRIHLRRENVDNQALYECLVVDEEGRPLELFFGRGICDALLNACAHLVEHGAVILPVSDEVRGKYISNERHHKSVRLNFDDTKDLSVIEVIRLRLNTYEVKIFDEPLPGFFSNPVLGVIGGLYYLKAKGYLM